MQDIIAAAALALRAYLKLCGVAQVEGMTDEQFTASVNEELRRLGSWLTTTNAAEDAVFRDPPNQD